MSTGLPKGIQRKHSRRCPAFRDKTAACSVKNCSYQVQKGPRGARETRTFPKLSEAKTWLADLETAKARRVGEVPTLRQAAERWREDADAGVALARGRKRFKPGTLHDYDRSLKADLLETYGDVPLDVLGGRLDQIVADLQRRGLAASTVRNTVMPLRAIYRHAVRMRWVSTNPTLGLEVPLGSGKRMRVAAAADIPKYIAALPERDRPLWATAILAGLRRGELMALRWADVDLASGRITIDAQSGGYDPKTRTTNAPKSDAGERRVPISGALREQLLEHRARAGARPGGLVFARGSLAGSCRAGTEQLPFNDSSTGQRSEKAFNDARLAPMTLHDFRHTFASLTIAAMAARGVFNPKLLQAVMGHSSIQVTYDRYGHLFPGQEAELGLMLDEFLGTDHALPEVAQAWSRMQDALGDAALDDALPVVAEALEELASWQRAQEEAGLVPSDAVALRPPSVLHESVQRTEGVREP